MKILKAFDKEVKGKEYYELHHEKRLDYYEHPVYCRGKLVAVQPLDRLGAVNRGNAYDYYRGKVQNV